MIFTFAIIGLVTSILGLLGLATGTLPGKRRRLLHILALILVMTAWSAGHRTSTGWITLIVAGGIEVWVLVAGRKGARQSFATAPSGQTAEDGPPAHCETEPPSPQESQSPELAAPDGASEETASLPPAPAPPFTTCALLNTPWDPSPDVFQASLRRGGLREVELAETSSSGEPLRFRTGPILLELTSAVRPVPTADIDYAVAQSWDWPQASTAVSGHRAHVLFTTRTTMNTPRSDVVRLHCRAHAALAEFAPVVAVLWRDAGRLAPPAMPTEGSRAPVSSLVPFDLCLTFRMFPPSETRPGQFVSDSVGLHAFGLPDLQVATAAEPDEAVSTVLYKLAERSFSEGCTLADGGEIDLGAHGRWKATRCQAAFPPDREVFELTHAVPEAVAPPAESSAD